MARTTAARGAIWLLLLFSALPAFSYSLLTHEELIDLTWDDSIVPLLLSRYPNLTAAQLQEARAYAYGGCVIQDIGYYPFGQMSYSNLTHYMRSGDFVVNLFRDARNANELAFAVGALSHYIGDSYGHALATNLAVPVEFHKLKRKYGPSVNYAEGEHQHVQTEFAFDIDEIAHHRMAPVRYLRHIGLKVPARQLSLAFYQTYGLSSKFTGLRRQGVNVGAYRFAAREFIPRIAYALTLIHRHDEPPDSDTPEAQALHAEVAAMAQENDWDKYRRHAGIGTWALAGFIVILPKVGPLKLVDVKGPTPGTEAEYVHSVVVSVTELRRALRRFTPVAKRRQNAPAAPLLPDSILPVMSHDPHHPLPNRDLDTGRVVQPGGYPLADSTYASLLHKLTRQPRVPIPMGIKEAIESYYADPELPITTRKDPRRWAEVQADLVTLKGMPTSPWPEPFPTYEEGQ
ncbi:MAG: zinc dependent phospholipase C family protein [Terracidiphilus sp.]